MILGRFAASDYFLPSSDDMKFYADWARRITEGQWSDGHAFYGLPGYAFFLAGIFSIAGPDPLAVGILQCLSEALIAVLLFKIARETLPGPAGSKEGASAAPGAGTMAGALAALGWVFFQPAQAFSVILMPTTWLVLAYWGSLWMVLRLRRSSPWWPWLALGVFAGAMAMLVATILFLLPVFFAAMARTIAPARPWAERAPRMTLAAAVLMAGVFAGASPAWIHNYFFARDPVLLSAHSGLNFYMGNHDGANGYPKIPEGLRASQEGLLRDSITRAEQAAGRPLKRSEVSRYWSEKARHWIATHPGAWLALLGRKLANFWNAFQYDDLSVISLLREAGVLPPGLGFGAVAALGLPGMLWAGWRLPRSRWVAAGVLLHMGALMPVFVTERYRLCAVPGLLIFAGFLVWETGCSLAGTRWGRAAALLAGAAAGVALVFGPGRDPGMRALDLFNTGLKVQRAGHRELARQKLEAALALVPENAELNFALGNLHFEEGAMEEARRFYLHALALAPTHTGVLNNLGRLEALGGNFELAEAHLRTSLTLEPKSPKALFFLAELKLAAGDRPGAQKALDAALTLRPGQPELLELQKKLAPPAP